MASVADFGQEMFAGFSKVTDRLVSGDGWEVVEENVEIVAGFEVVEKRANRDAGARKDRFAAHDVWIDHDKLRIIGHIGKLTIPDGFTRQ